MANNIVLWVRCNVHSSFAQECRRCEIAEDMNDIQKRKLGMF